MSGRNSGKRQGPTGPYPQVKRAWAQAAALCGGRIDAFTAAAVKAMKLYICGGIPAACANAGGLAARDEEVFVCHRNLMERYSGLANRYSESRGALNDPIASAILDGIYSVIVSRLSAADEIGASRDPNPIFLEKKSIISERVKSFSAEFDFVLNGFKRGNGVKLREEALKVLIFGADYRRAVEALSRFMEEFNEQCMESLYGIYLSAVRAAASEMNDLSSRRALGGYIELLSQESCILDDLAAAQLPALEPFLNGENITGEEKNVILNVVFSLNEAKEEFDADYVGLSEFFASASELPPADVGADEFETFRDEARAAACGDVACGFMPIQTFDEFNNELSKKVSAFKEAFAKEAAAKPTETGFGEAPAKYRYKFTKAVCGELLMADEMRAAFEAINDYYETNKDTLENDAIIAGIDETVRIKRDAIGEAKDAFSEEMQLTLGGFSALNSPPPGLAGNDDIISQIDESASEATAELCGAADESAAARIINERIAGAEGAVANRYAEIFNAAAVKYDEILRNKLLKFKKEYLLQEMVTFEEILYYSVSRLRESGDPAVAEYVEMADRESGILFDILRKNGVEIIKPEPHDAFNGREHEVLLAEADENFKKGEIIKPVNSGYRIGDAVLIRANVIAAR